MTAARNATTEELTAWPTKQKRAQTPSTSCAETCKTRTWMPTWATTATWPAENGLAVRGEKEACHRLRH